MADKIPIVTIVGRQNVGKSTLFNSMIKKKKSIVDKFPGLTRDIIRSDINHNSIVFKLSDTPGLDLPKTSVLSKVILDNAEEHLRQSSVIIMLMENPAPEPYDIDLADFIRKLSIPVIVAVNKMDDNTRLENMINFYETGFNEIIPISALNRFNISLLMDTIVDILPVKKTSANIPDINLAVVGRPNSGKSTLLNSLIGYNRSVVSEIPGTTRDSVDDDFKFFGKHIRIVDTAGIRKKSKINENIEYYSFTRTVDSIKKSDVVIHLIDAEIGISDTDKKISDEIIKSKKPIIIAVNKWDLIDKNHKSFNDYREKLIFKFYKAGDFPIISISARDKLRIHKIIKTALELNEKVKTRISTPELNKIITDLQKRSKIQQHGNIIKIYYATQIQTSPPRFKFFVNNKDYFKKDIMRFFEKNLQRILGLNGIPFDIIVEGKKRKSLK